KILVRQAAQQTDAKQTNRALLLSDTAKLDTKPQLEIFADDVKCTHGATVGNLDELALFYLKTRGLSKPAARQMLTLGFATEVRREFWAEPVRDPPSQRVQQRLGVGESKT